MYLVFNPEDFDCNHRSLSAPIIDRKKYIVARTNVAIVNPVTETGISFQTLISYRLDLLFFFGKKFQLIEFLLRYDVTIMASMNGALSLAHPWMIQIRLYIAVLNHDKD